MASASTFNKMKTPMRYKFLGAAGVQVSELSFGCMTFDEGGGMVHGSVQGEAAFDMMRICFEHGVNFFDNAEVYGGANGVSERIMGEAIRRGIEHGIWQRKELVISTKLFGGTTGRRDEQNPNVLGLSRKHLTEGLLESLRRMQLDYVDLLFCHRPDPSVRIEETVRTMNDLIKRGLCFYWGTSEWSAAQLQEAIGCASRLGLEPPMFDQCQYSLVERARVEREYVPLYPNLGLTVWSPLAGGALSGKYKKPSASETPTRFGALQKMDLAKLPPATKSMMQNVLSTFDRAVSVADAVLPIADELGCTLAQLALAWAAANKNVSTVIIGATSVEQLKESFGALAVVEKLTPEIMARIDEAAGTRPDWDSITAQTRERRASRL